MRPITCSIKSPSSEGLRESLEPEGFSVIVLYSAKKQDTVSIHVLHVLGLLFTTLYN